MSERIAVVAPGGIGGPLGGLLTRAGHDVTLVDQWPAHVDAMRDRGLRITVGPREDPESDDVVPVRAHHVHEVCTLREPFDVVFVTCKSYDTRWLVQLIAPRLAPDGVVVSTQNSLNFEWIAPIVGPERTMSCLLTGGGELLEPGHVWRNRRSGHPYYTVGELDGRGTSRARHIAEVLADAGRTTLARDVRASLWTKLVHNGVSAALSGLVARSRRSWELLAEPGYREASAGLYREGIAVAMAHGQRLESLFGRPAEELRDASDEAIENLIAATGGGASHGATSMVQQDLARGRPTEVTRYFNGLLAHKGREAGVPTPLHDAMVALYERLERGELAQSLDNLLLLASPPPVKGPACRRSSTSTTTPYPQASSSG
jgi:2-dehydropantoate 2-reductase